METKIRETGVALERIERDMHALGRDVASHAGEFDLDTLVQGWGDTVHYRVVLKRIDLERLERHADELKHLRIRLKGLEQQLKSLLGE